MKKFIKDVFKRIGLLQPATDCIDFFRSLAFVRESFKYRIHGAPDGFPIPPDRLIYKVAGTASIQFFLEMGRFAADSIESALLKKNVQLRTLSSVLDFGCGCGRVIRWMRKLTEGELYGSDFNPSLVRWCVANLKFGRFTVNQINPPLQYAANSFDLIYALSVFTHMDESLQQSWMDEFARVLKPGGYLALSLHGEYYLDQLSDVEKQQFLAGKLVIRSGGALGSNRFASYHPPGYFKNSLSSELSLADIIERGAKGNPYQDLYLFKRSE